MLRAAKFFGALDSTIEEDEIPLLTQPSEDNYRNSKEMSSSNISSSDQSTFSDGRLGAIVTEHRLIRSAFKDLFILFVGRGHNRS
jgi:hypothetical protein